MIKFLLTIIALAAAVFLSILIQNFGCEYPAILGAVLAVLLWRSFETGIDAQNRGVLAVLVADIAALIVAIIGASLILAIGCSLEIVTIAILTLVLWPAFAVALGVHRPPKPPETTPAE